MKSFAVSDGFLAALMGDLDKVEEKNRQFAEQLAELRLAYGGGERIAATLAAVKASDDALRERLVCAPWSLLMERIEGMLIDALSGETSDVSGPEASVELYWSLEHPEIHRRRSGTKAGPIWRRRALVTFDALYGELMVPARSSAAYPIIFTHDVDDNHRTLVTAALINLTVEALGSALGSEGLANLAEARIKLTMGEGGPVIWTWREGRVAERHEVAAGALGFRPEREIVRLLEGYVDQDPRAHVRFYQLRLEGALTADAGELREGFCEAVDLVDPAGRALRLERDPAMTRVRRLQRESSELVRKRKHLFVDPAPIRVEVLELEQGQGLLEGFDAALQASVDSGYRIVYARLVRPESSDSSPWWQYGEALAWS
jgi:hypothetical protein